MAELLRRVTPPPSVLASWPKPNYVDPETRGRSLLIISIILPTLGVIIVTARIYARLFITKAFGIDDGLIAISLFFAIAYSSLVAYSSEHLDIGHHIWDVPPSLGSAIQLNAFCTEWFWASALCTVKISILLFYRRLSMSFSKFFMWATWIGIGFNVLYFSTFALFLLLECRPIEAYWRRSDPKWLAAGNTYSCSGRENIVLPMYSALSVLGDFYSTVLPLSLVYSLKMRPRQKRSLYALFGLGFFVVAAGIVRTVYVNDVENVTYDGTWMYYDVSIWVSVEMYLAMFCASAPGLKPFFQKFFIDPMTQYSAQSERSGHGLDPGNSIIKRQYLRQTSETDLNKLGGSAVREEAWAVSELDVEMDRLENHDTHDKKGTTIYSREVGLAG